jgi:hypothetical protein
MDTNYYSDIAIRERCMVMALNAHEVIDLSEETIRETAHKAYNFIKYGLVHDEVEEGLVEGGLRSVG